MVSVIVAVGLGTVALLGILLGTFASPVILGSSAALNYRPTSETKDFVVFSDTSVFNDTAVGIPHDLFTPSTLVVNQGDQVIIHFYNTEASPEHHNLILPAYNINVDLGRGEHQDITFTANQAGTFRFYCSFHLPTMTGQLIVLATSR